MPTLTLTRFASTSSGTPGCIPLEDGSVIFTLELPWLGNEHDVSCIPTGIYDCRYASNRKMAGGKRINTYEVCEVPGRSGILFHVGNTIKDSRGCILCGLGIRFEKAYTLQDSQKGFRRLIAALDLSDEWSLDIKWVDGLVSYLY